jgi:hypothetical protein
VEIDDWIIQPLFQMYLFRTHERRKQRCAAAASAYMGCVVISTLVAEVVFWPILDTTEGGTGVNRGA